MADMLSMLGDLAKQREKTVQVVKQTEQQIGSADQAFMGSLTNLSRQQQVVFTEANKTLERLRTLNRMPTDLVNIFGVFSENWSPDAQQVKLQQSELELQRIGLQMNTAQAAHRTVVNQADRQQDTAVKILQFTREGLLDQQRLAEFGLSLKEHEIRMTEHQRAVLERNLADQDVDTLINWQMDPTKAPKELQGKPGLIRAMILQKSDAQVQANIRQLSLSLAEKDQALRGMTTEQMEIALRNGTPPPGLSLGEIEEKYMKNTNSQLMNESAKLALQAGNLELHEKLKAQRIMNSTSGEIQSMLNDMGEENRISIDGIEFSRAQLAGALALKVDEERTRNNAMMDRLISLSGVQSQTIESGVLAQSLQAVTNPHTVFDPENPYTMLPPAVQVKAVTNDAKIAQAEALGSADLMIKYGQEQVEFLRSAKEAYIENQPKEVQEATREYMENGRFITARNANDYMMNNIGNPGALGPDPVLSPIWNNLNAAFIELAKSQTTGFNIDPSTGTFEFTGKGLDAGVLMEEAIRKGNVRNVAKSHLYQEALRVALTNLRRGAPDVWGKYVNLNSGSLSSLFYGQKENEDGSVGFVFDPNELARTLAADSTVLQQKGVLQPNESLLDLLIGEVRTTGLPAIRQAGAGSIGGNALMYSLFGEVPEAAVAQEILVLESSAKVAINEAMKTGQRIDEARELQNLLQPPGRFGPQAQPISPQMTAPEEAIRRAMGGRSQ